MQAGPVFGWLCGWKAMPCLDLKGLLPVSPPSGLFSISFSGDSEPKGEEKSVLGSRFSWPQEDPVDSQRERGPGLRAPHVLP